MQPCPASGVVTVEPGFVRMRMAGGTALPSRPTAAPEEVAATVADAIRRRNAVRPRFVRRPATLAIGAVAGRPSRPFPRMAPWLSPWPGSGVRRRQSYTTLRPMPRERWLSGTRRPKEVRAVSRPGRIQLPPCTHIA